MQFSLDKEERKKATEFTESHKCTLKDVGAIGGETTYCFTMTNLGCVLKVKCACGKEEDLTDYDAW